jgi:hypothetical protein
MTEKFTELDSDAKVIKGLKEINLVDLSTATLELHDEVEASKLECQKMARRLHRVDDHTANLEQDNRETWAELLKIRLLLKNPISIRKFNSPQSLNGTFVEGIKEKSSFSSSEEEEIPPVRSPPSILTPISSKHMLQKPFTTKARKQNKPAFDFEQFNRSLQNSFE